MSTNNITITRHGRRNWAVHVNGELLAVTVYRKGARAIATFISNASTKMA